MFDMYVICMKATCFEPCFRWLIWQWIIVCRRGSFFISSFLLFPYVFFSFFTTHQSIVWAHSLCVCCFVSVSFTPINKSYRKCSFSFSSLSFSLPLSLFLSLSTYLYVSHCHPNHIFSCFMWFWTFHLNLWCVPALLLGNANVNDADNNAEQIYYIFGPRWEERRPEWGRREKKETHKIWNH